jgi:hypothetical protein
LIAVGIAPVVAGPCTTNATTALSSATMKAKLVNEFAGDDAIRHVVRVPCDRTTLRHVEWLFRFSG